MGDFEQMAQAGSLGGGAYPTASDARMVRQPTMKERIAMAVQQAEERLAAVKQAQEIFERNPDLETLLNIMQRAHF